MEFEAIMAKTANLNEEDLLHDCRPLLVIYKDGRVQILLGENTVPASLDSATGVESKDVVINDETGMYVPLYKPQNVERVGVLVYYHGGGFCVETASAPLYHNYLNSLSCKSNMIVVSVDYRTAPEHPLPIGYKDSWAALRWLSMSHDEPWIRDNADLSRVLMAGDSAGANIVHQMAKRIGMPNELIGCNLIVKGIVLIHPYFWGKERIGSEAQKVQLSGFNSLADKIWKVVCPESCGSNDPLLNPGMDSEIGKLGVEKVMVCVAEQDLYRDRGFYYKEVLLKSRWKGSVSVVETLEVDHVFHLFEPGSPEATNFMNQIVAFCNKRVLISMMRLWKSKPMLILNDKAKSKS